MHFNITNTKNKFSHHQNLDLICSSVVQACFFPGKITDKHAWSDIAENWILTNTGSWWTHYHTSLEVSVLHARWSLPDDLSDDISKPRKNIQWSEIIGNKTMAREKNKVSYPPEFVWFESLWSLHWQVLLPQLLQFGATGINNGFTFLETHACLPPPSVPITLLCHFTPL